MARPRKDTGELPAEQKLEEAFWEMVRDHPVEKISIGMLTAKAGCNRGTFYYYYDDIYQMVDVLIDKSLPKAVPLYFFPRMGSGIDRRDLGTIAGAEQPGLDHLCLLLNSTSSPWIKNKVKAEMMRLWKDALGIDIAAMSGDARVVFEFAANGLLGIMAYRAETNFTISVEDILSALAPEIIEALLGRMKASIENARTEGSGAGAS